MNLSSCTVSPWQQRVERENEAHLLMISPFIVATKLAPPFLFDAYSHMFQTFPSSCAKLLVARRPMIGDFEAIALAPPMSNLKCKKSLII